MSTTSTPKPKPSDQDSKTPTTRKKPGSKANAGENGNKLVGTPVTAVTMIGNMPIGTSGYIENDLMNWLLKDHRVYPEPVEGSPNAVLYRRTKDEYDFIRPSGVTFVKTF